MKLSLARRRLLSILIAVAAIVVVVLLILIAIGVLRLPTPSPPQVTVNAAQWQILQGNTSFGFGWFGPSTRNVTNTDGLPITVNSGGSFVMSLVVSNLDKVNHTIYSVTAAAPFRVSGYIEGVGTEVRPGSDEWLVEVTVVAPSVSSNASYTLLLTMNALYA